MTIGHFIVTSIAAFSVICVIAVLFFERKNPASSLAWVLVLLFLPVVGFILYIFLGAGFKVNKRRKYAVKAVTDDIYDKFIVNRLNLERSRSFMGRNNTIARLLTYLKNDGEGVLTNNNDAEIYTDGNDMFRALLADLEAATRHIHIFFYIFRNDDLGRRIVKILTEKVKAGVEVRLMYDSVGTLMAFDTMFRELKTAGGEVAAFSPIFSSLNSHLRLNYRNHRKIVVVDGRVGYVGGMNVGVEYMGMDKRLRPWRDTHLRITGSAVWFLQERFLMDWAYTMDIDPHRVDVETYFPDPVESGNLAMQIVSSGPDTFESPIKSGMLTMIYGARKSVYIQTPYFAPDESFFDAVRIAARSDVDVRLMIPTLSDYQVVHRATLGYARDALECGVKVYQYRGFIHSKTVVVDGRVASIGTTNITNRSFTLDFEINAFVYDEAFAARNEAIFLADQANSDQLSKEAFEKQSVLTRLSYNCCRLLAPMM